MTRMTSAEAIEHAAATRHRPVEVHSSGYSPTFECSPACDGHWVTRGRVVPISNLMDVVPEECWVFRIEATERLSCTRLIGGKIGDGDVEFTEEMCCLPCRIRLVVERNGVDV